MGVVQKKRVRATRFNLVQQYLQDEDIAEIFQRVSGRVYGFYQQLDGAIDTGTDSRVQRLAQNFLKLRWARDYKKWKREYPREIASNGIRGITAYLDAAKADIKGKRGVVNAEDKELLDEIEKRRSGVFGRFQKFLEVFTSGTGLEAPDGLGNEFDVIYDGI